MHGGFLRLVHFLRKNLDKNVKVTENLQIWYFMVNDAIYFDFFLIFPIIYISIIIDNQKKVWYNYHV